MSDADFLTDTRRFYDAVAEDYAERFRDPHAERPLDRAVLGAYAELVGGTGQVADLGCGPGRVTAYLAALGLRVYGLDLSESMLAVARRENPGLRFEQGSMLDLDLADGALAGVVSWYSTVHFPEDRLPELFAEFRRVLAPGGHLLLGFPVGDRPRRYEQPFGYDGVVEFQRRRPDRIADLLAAAGLSVRARTVRETEGTEASPQAFLIARRP
ncbi:MULTISPECIES: class I SAM-dependent methyltransferase [unclassified Streptomyces]|uniref:class I SAM-dependent methyltransferase n=1 Tax=unclassified Streptomyces TaxID=2593676 RepID=UPI001661BB88|nr:MULTISPECIES: class I SAM-dependent methyltransferase [unclassified Streptomyces]MBD0842777.1 methyltransferase domain-containing protein [Streptomyces sp. TRM68416]